MENKEAVEKINNLIKEAMDKIREAETIANQTNTPFSFKPAYGMGGTYYPSKENKEGFEGDGDDYYESDYYESGWVSSSSNC